MLEGSSDLRGESVLIEASIGLHGPEAGVIVELDTCYTLFLD